MSIFFVQISEDGAAYFVHSREVGLLAALDTNGDPDLFYEFNMDGYVKWMNIICTMLKYRYS